ncbi:AMP-dependent synthetase [Micromonospora sp. KC207]|uniref:AMP-binding protein n=1 Tax=Micromonospora sp. KC207 TaxID=2530377 RepID=UPI00104EEFA7|nr:AMP-binding protein [Micromonospora sp. KC207]TDC65382.1 AMP-dependent synthetase [Micromonospora sp. KC207]
MAETPSEPLYARFLRGLARSGREPAIRVGDRCASYPEVHELALRWAGALAGTGARAVGVLADKGVTGYVGTLAALYAGATVVPLRPDFPPARTRQLLAAAGVGALVVDESGCRLLPELLDERSPTAVLAPDLAPGRHRALIGSAAAGALDRPVPVRPDDVAYILFTSGSTGRPKGVRITHGNTAHYFRQLDARYDFAPQDVFSQTFELNFDCALFDLFSAWGAGATAVAVPAPAYRELPAFLAGAGVTVWFSTPSAIDLVRRMGGLSPAALAGLRWSFFAGEALQCRDAADWQRAAPHSTLENLYGPTELTITVTAHRWAGADSERLAVNGVVPIGVLHEGHDRLLLGDDGERDDREGELCVAGPQLAAGYLDPADEAGRFLHRAGRRFYRTGDRVRRVAGDQLLYLGRRDFQVQVQGQRVELAEVEHALRACGAYDAVAVGVPGPASTELFAFYTGTPVPVVDLVRRLRGLLPDGVIPRHYRHMTEFPLNGNRKIDRTRLAERARELLAGTGSGAA